MTDRAHSAASQLHTQSEEDRAVVGLPLSHYARAGFSYDPARTYAPDEHRLWHKPSGIWLSADGPDDWPSWCHGEQWGLDRIVERHTFRVVPGANILHISDVDGIDALHVEFGKPDGFWEARGSKRSSSLDWPAVMVRWDGIIIAPYQWERRLHGDASWYYGWDCASGCVWNLSALEYVGQQPLLPLPDDEAAISNDTQPGTKAEGRSALIQNTTDRETG